MYKVYDVGTDLRAVKNKDKEIVGFKVNTTASTYHSKHKRMEFLGGQFNQQLKDESGNGYNKYMFFSINNHLNYIFFNDKKDLEQGYSGKNELNFAIKKDQGYANCVAKFISNQKKEIALNLVILKEKGNIAKINLPIKTFLREKNGKQELSVDYESLNNATNKILQEIENIPGQQTVSLNMSEFISSNIKMLRDKVVLDTLKSARGDFASEPGRDKSKRFIIVDEVYENDQWSANKVENNFLSFNEVKNKMNNYYSEKSSQENKKEDPDISNDEIPF